MLYFAGTMNELHWKNARGIPLFAAEWPVKGPRAVIALVHGQGEHIGRYAHLAAWFNRHDIAVLGFDHQGYGRSGGKRGHARDLDALLDDIGQLLEEALRRKHGWTYSQGANLETWPMGVVALNLVARMRSEVHSAATRVLRNLWRSTCESLGKQDPEHRYTLDRARGAHALRYMHRGLDRSELSVPFLTYAWLEQALPKHRAFVDIPPEEFPVIARHAPKLADLEWHMISVVQDT